MKLLAKLYNYIRCVPRTVYFNFYYLPMKQAMRFPIIVSHRTKFQSMKGNVIVPSDAKTAKIKLGFGVVQVADNRYSRFIWDVREGGEIEFGNNIKVGTGCKLYVSGVVKIGDGCNFTGECSLNCSKKITFGERCLISWRTVIMDTDFHAILDVRGKELNPDKEIIIGKSVWICACSSILKGVRLGDNSVVSGSSNVVDSFDQNVILGGNPAKIIGSMIGKTVRH